MTAPDAEPLAHGVTVYDESADRYGTVADTTTSPGVVFVRPLGGGIEWRVRRECLRPAQASELLALRLRKGRSAAEETSS